MSSGGQALAQRLGYAWIDVDDIFWEPTDPPFQQERCAQERLRRMEKAIAANPQCVISGWLGGNCGNALLPKIDLIIWLQAPTELRIKRLRAREQAQFGARVLPGGDMHENHEAFIEWAGKYDGGGMELRSRARQEAWLQSAMCPVLAMDGARDTQALASEILDFRC